jgi:hypothetical protein
MKKQAVLVLASVMARVIVDVPVDFNEATDTIPNEI